MFKFAPFLVALAFLMPGVAEAAFAVPWVATSTTGGLIQPNGVNGSVFPIMIPSFFSTSTTATSTIAGGLRITGGGLRVGTLISCNTVDTDTSGNFICGTDSVGGGSAGTGNVATSSIEADNQVATFSSSGATPATVDGDTGFTFDGSTDTLVVGSKLGIATTSPYAALSIGDPSGIVASKIHATSSATSIFDAAPTFSTLTSAVLLTGSGGLTAEYTGATCTNQFVRSLSALAAATCASVVLTADVTGTLPIANGGTNATAFVANTLVAFDGARLASTSTSPIYVGSVVSTTTATSTFVGGVQTLRVDATATSTMVGLRVTSGGLIVGSLLSCDTIDTDASGTLKCGADASGGGGGGGVGWASTTASVESIYSTGLGYVGIGTTTPKYNLQLASSTAPQLVLSDASNPAWAFRASRGSLYLATTTPGTFATSSPPAAEFRSTGVGTFIGATSSPDSSVTGMGVTGTVVFESITQATGGTNNDVCIDGNNNLVEETTDVCAVSMRSEKLNIAPLIFDATDSLMKLKPVSYQLKLDEESDYKDTKYGFIAEDVADVDPHFAQYGIDGKPRTLDDRALLALAIKSIQEQQEQIDDLSGKSRNTSLYILVGLLALMNLFLFVRLYGNR